jgi:hypothetical protein
MRGRACEAAPARVRVVSQSFDVGEEHGLPA